MNLCPRLFSPAALDSTLTRFCLLIALALVSGCGKPKEVSSVARAEARHLATEAETHTLLRDYSKAEEALTRATELDPEVAIYWAALAHNRALAGDKAGAKKALKRELALHEQAAKKDSKSLEARLLQLRPLVLLGRADDARKLLQQTAKHFPQDPQPKQLIEMKAIDQLLVDPRVKELL
jgi:tetratricopeptide (TPR) repeat protein